MSSTTTISRPRTTKLKVATSNPTEQKRTRVLIHTDTKAYDEAKKKHTEFHYSLDELVTALDEFKKVKTNQISLIIESPLSFMENHILESKESINTMNLKYKVLIDILELNVDDVEMKAKKLSNLNAFHYDKPSLKDFEVYTNRMDQVERLNALNGIIEGLNALEPTEQEYNLTQLKSALIRSFGGRFVSAPNNIFLPIPNVTYVLKGKVF